MNLDQNLRTILRERAESVAAAPVVPERTVRRVRVRKTLSAGGALAVVAAVAVAGIFALKSTVWTDAAPVSPADQRERVIEQRPVIEQNPKIGQKSITSQVAIIRQMADAINARDTDAFIDLFAREGDFNSRGVFPSSSSLFGSLPVADTELVWAWMDINDAWGLQAEVEVCDAMTGPIRPVFGGTDVRIECEVRARWQNLSLEIIEGWNFEFEGTRLLAWGLSRPFTYASEFVELNPPDRTLPLGYDGLLAWEEWLKANHPEAAARYLNPRAEGPPVGCDGCRAAQRAWDRAGRSAPLLDIAERSWSIHGYDFSPVGYIPYDPAFADEIQASIQEYLDSR